MQNESIYVDNNFLNYINAEYEEFCYADRRYVYYLDKKNMHIKSTLCKNLEISDELVEYIFENFHFEAHSREAMPVPLPRSAAREFFCAVMKADRR